MLAGPLRLGIPDSPLELTLTWWTEATFCNPGPKDVVVIVDGVRHEVPAGESMTFRRGGPPPAERDGP